MTQGGAVLMEPIKTKIREFLSRFFRTSDLGDRDDIFELGFVNSLFAMRLVTWAEQEFGLRIEDEDLDIENFNSIEAIARLVERKTTGAAS
jgi:methoxymalonate biosynthesis acyl carrier protein